jgi:hypothetical protein
LIVVNVEVQDSKAGEGVIIQPDAPNKQYSEPDGDDDDVQDGGIASGTDSGSEENDGGGFITVTRSGRSVRAPRRLIEKIGGAEKITRSESNYYVVLMGACDAENGGNEFGYVGAGLGCGFENTSELHVVNYNAAMESDDKGKWKVAAKEEYERMVNHNVFQKVPRDEVPEGAHILTATWAMKKKSNGTLEKELIPEDYRRLMVSIMIQSPQHLL